MKPIVADIETNLKHDHIWCAGTYDIESSTSRLHVYDGVELRADINERDVVAHNGIYFDFPKLAEYWGVVVPPERQIDTLILSRLHNPSIEGGHSLKAWGQRLLGDDGKIDFPVEQFDLGYTEEMGEYCVQDCAVNAQLYNTLVYRLARDGFSQRCIDLEHDIARITYEQEKHGFLLDVQHATTLFTENVGRMTEIEGILQERFPPITHERYSERTGKRLKDVVEVFNVGSRQQVAKRLEGLGAKWKQKTETGKWVVNETTLDEIDLPEAALVKEYLTLQKRSGMVDSWLAAVQDDGRVHGRVQTLGAVTGRMTHSSPNMAQIPGVPEYRQCWTVPEGYILVGCDASQLELRLLAHYMQDSEYVDQILNGDIHSYNQEMAGLATRDQAKTFIYALIYGAGDGKIGQIVGGNVNDGRELKRKFFASLPAYRRLIARVEGIAEAGVVPGLDGRRIRVRHKHAALNTLLQGGGAVVMKQATVDLMNLIKQQGRDAHLVAQVHDEVQLEVEENEAWGIGNLAVECIRKTEQRLDLRCPMDGEYKMGRTWADTH
jgi:DNA polymerase I-like protein with 3'-5' exonuclease and polymerase domains